MMNSGSYIRIFGYGSLMFPRGINGRGLSCDYDTDDLVECTLSDHRRTWDSIAQGERYMGLRYEKGISTTGVCFSLYESDLGAFMESEGFDLKRQPYTLNDVSSLINLSQDGIKTFTCVTHNPSFNAPISRRYWNIIWQALKHHSNPESLIPDNFTRTTDWSGFMIGK